MSIHQKFGLSQEQQQVSQYSDGAVLLVPASEGLSGKFITSRISWLLQNQNVNNDQVLAITSSDSSKLVKDHLHSVLSDGTEIDSMWIGSIYAIALRLITRHAKEAGLPSLFQLLDLSTQAKYIKPLVSDKSVTVEQAREYINTMKGRGIRAKDVAPEGELSEVYASYERLCNSENLVDFNELLLRSCELFEASAEVSKQYREQFMHIVVDDFNTLNYLQYRLLQSLFSNDAKVFAVSNTSNGSVSLDKFKSDFGISKTLTV